MADACCTWYQSVLKTVEDFLKSIDELTNENKGRLSKLREVSELAASIEKEKGEVKGTPRVDECIALIRTVFSDLLFGSYTELLSKLSDILSTIYDMENKQQEDESFVLPKVMQERIAAVKHYLKKAKGRLEEIDETLSDLIRKVKNARRKQFKISDEEIEDLKMEAEDVDRTLNASKSFLDQAENEINMLESDIASEVKSFRMKTAAKTLGIGAVLMVGGALLLSSEILKLTVKEVAAKLGYVKGGLLVGGAVAGAACLGLQIAVIIDDHKKMFTRHLDTLKIELSKVKADYAVMRDDYEKGVARRMAERH